MNKIEIIGLGAGDLDQLPVGIYKRITKAERLFLRTKEHPVVTQLEQEGMKYESFDYIYEAHETFEKVYENICLELFNQAKQHSIVYAVPGHPLVAEQTVQQLINQADEAGVEVEIIGGQSFLDPLFQSLKIDPIEGFQLLDGTKLSLDEINLRQHIIIGQVYDTFIASEVKLTPMEKLPYDYQVSIVTAAGTSKEVVKEVSLHELDREVHLSNLTSVYVPPVNNEEILYKDFAKLRGIIAELRGPNGCPWDKKQTNKSLTKYLLEESYELIEAIQQDDIDHIIEELGDVLLQVMLHAQIGEDDGYFSIQDVIEGISRKMIRRHPHVFGSAKADTAEEVLVNWQQIKDAEKGSVKQGILDGVGTHIPTLMRAHELQHKAAKVGFDWEQASEAWLKVKEEILEFEAELDSDEKKEQQMKEFGDLLFALVNVARLLDIHPEEALHHTNQKFIKRFAYVEEQVQKSGKTFADFTLEQLDSFWDEAKSNGI